MLFESGLGDPFVFGTDATGQFVGVFANQEGLPADCFIIPAGGYHGIERGSFIELEGVLWRKAPTFRSSQPAPAPGDIYPPYARFCFDERAQITSIVP